MMEPQRTTDDNILLKGDPNALHADGVGIGDLPAVFENGSFRTHWKPDEADLAALNAGGYVQLWILSDRHPPVDVCVVQEKNKT